MSVRVCPFFGILLSTNCREANMMHAMHSNVDKSNRIEYVISARYKYEKREYILIVAQSTLKNSLTCIQFHLIFDALMAFLNEE